MKIAIVGSGAMGGTLATALQLSGNDVYVLDASSELISHIRKHGIEVATPRAGTVIGTPGATTEAAEIGIADLVVVLVKSTHTGEVAKTLQPLIDEQTSIMSLQNGWGNVEVLATAMPRDQLIQGVTYNSCHVRGLGKVDQSGVGATYIGDYAGGTTRSTEVAAVLTEAGWDCTATADAATEVWKKLILNSVSLPLSALTRFPAVEVVTYPPIAELAEDIARESCAIARAAGYDIDDDERIAAIRATNTRAGRGKPSMLQDVERRRSTEIDVINGAIVKTAASYGISAPLNAALARLVSGLEHSWELDG
ncbi:ketopantoate reductase family protein [Kribbella kalugense]|uniref:2-dehydropantoate 2-reductase n=1 Tax=Kribbella kalugense TaxID=2512221 RepID=A0A4R8A4A0_9ACTN|nr:2-dehydropantoate 2-reductase [Kribbella kalugense]TDW24298.1 ketopantoate reductase [Kribbella kalugense]